MAVTDQQKLDFLLKKIGYTKTKTGSVVGTGAISGTPKQPFAEAIPSPLVVPNSSLWNEAGSIPATAPGSDTTQVKVYLAASSGLRMTADATSSGQRAYIAYTTYGNTSSARLTNWIDTQFGASYLIKVYKGDPNSGGVALSAAGSGANDGWFFDYSAGVLNFNDTSVPSGVTDTNIYIVGYRYIGQTGAPTSGISTFSHLDLTVERNLDVGVQGGISTFRNNIDLNADLDVDGHTNLDNVNIVGVATVNGEITFPDYSNPNNRISFGDSQDLKIWHTGSNGHINNSTGHLYIQGTPGNNYVYIAPAGGGAALARFDMNGSGARLYSNGATRLLTQSDGVRTIGTLQADNLNVTGVTTTVTVDVNGDLDVDGHTNLDNISVAGVSTFTGDATFSGNVSIGGTLTYEDVINVDSVGIVTARAGIRVTGGVIEAQAGENKIPSLYAAMGNLPSAGSYHGMFAHVHATGRGYFAHAGNWLELVNKETNGVVGTGTERYNVGPIDAVDINVSSSSTTKSLNVTGVTTVVTLDVNGDLDVDGHTNLDNLSVAGVSTFGSVATFNNNVNFIGQNSGRNIVFRNGATLLEFADNAKAVFGTGGDLEIHHSGNGSIIDNTGGTGNLSILGSQIFIGYSGGNGIQVVQNGEVELRFNNNPKLNTTNSGVTVTGTLVADGADINGDLDVDGHANLDNVSIAGFTTITQDLDVDGHTNLDNVSIAGVTTITQDLDVDGHTNLDNVSVAGVTTFSGIVDAINTPASIRVAQDIQHKGDADTKISFPSADTIRFDTAGTQRLNIASNGNISVTNDLDVDGHTNLDNVSIAGVTTFAANARFNGTIGVHDGTTGGNGQYLRATGTGVTWGSFPTMRTSQTFTASSGQTSFSFTYNVGYLDVFVNGVKLSTSEFTANNGSTVVLSVGSFVGDIVELVSYFTTSYAAGEPGITELVQDPTPQLGGNLDLFNKTVEGTGNVNMTGVVTATKFVGDGSLLTGIVASGSGVAIKNSGSLVGTAGTIDFGANLSVSPVSAGIVTITGAAGGGSGSGISTISGVVNIVNDLDVDGHTNLDNVSISGVTTGTTINATTFVGNGDFVELDVDGHTNLDNVSVAGVTTFASAITASGALSVSDIRSNSLNLKNAAGSATYAVFTNGGSALLKHNNTDRLETTNAGITVTGNVTATTFSGNATGLTGNPTIGVTDLDVDGHANLDNVSIAGVTTFAGAIDLNADLDVDGHANLDNVSVAGVTTFDQGVTFQSQSVHSDGLRVGTAITFSPVGNATYTGIITAQTFVGDGSGLTGVVGSGSGVAIKDSGSTVGTAGTINFADGLNVTDISAGIVTVSTATTSLSSGNSKVFVNSESSSTNNGSFEVLLQDNTSSGAGRTAFKLYQPADNQNKVEFFSNNFSLISTLDLNCGFAGNAGNSLRFKTNGAYNFTSTIFVGTSKTFEFKPDGSNTTVQFSESSGSYFKTRIQPTGSDVDLGTNGNKFKDLHLSGGINAVGVVTASSYRGDGSQLTGISGGTSVGITTNLSGSFTASAGTAATINTLTGYSANDLVVEYTIYIKNGSDFQTQKLLAMRDGTTIHSTQFAVMFSSSLLVQCDATISSGNILLRATPETGVSGSTTYKIKREVM